MKKKPSHAKKMSTDLANKFNNYTQENLYNHPVIFKSTLSGAILTGILVALITWLFSSGILGTEEPLIRISMSPLVLTLIGLIAGSAVGGVIGSVYGIFLMLKEKG